MSMVWALTLSHSHTLTLLHSYTLTLTILNSSLTTITNNVDTRDPIGSKNP